MDEKQVCDTLQDLGLIATEAKRLSQFVQQQLALSPQHAWQQVCQQYLQTGDKDFAIHEFLYRHCYTDAPVDSAAAWFPDAEYTANSNLSQLMKQKDFADYSSLHRWSVTNFQAYWAYVLQQLTIQFKQPASAVCVEPNNVENPQWLPDARLNIVDSCFQADAEQIAVTYQAENESLKQVTYGELDILVNRVAQGLVAQGFQAGDAIAIDMPMTLEAVMIYLGIVKAGCVVVAIADSFSATEIATRLRIANAKAIFTQDVLLRGKKQLPLYEKVMTANAPCAIVIAADEHLSLALRDGDIAWHDFLSTEIEFTSVACAANSPMNILFSSGTTGDPKAIPWDHSTPIKVAADAFFHQNIQAGDVLAWPTNLGWMMGPWLVYAALLNRATIGLYYGSPLGRSFGEFVQNAKVNVLGLVPSLVKVWRETQCMQGLNWQSIKLFSSTGECSNTYDMLYLMSLANYKPVIEYCGGTEIGGAYLTSTVLTPNVPATFSTPALGIDVVLIDEQGTLTDNGEVALLGASMGLSHQLLNRDHHETYFANMPNTAAGQLLRRHGDQIQRLGQGYYQALGRVDDTMNLGAIKTSSADIERVLDGMDNVHEIAAVAITPATGGPSELVIFVVPIDKQSADKKQLKQSMQLLIKQQLNPLFKIQDVVLMDALPRTASNKIMRRVLRDSY